MQCLAQRGISLIGIESKYVQRKKQIAPVPWTCKSSVASHWPKSPVSKRGGYTSEGQRAEEASAGPDPGQRSKRRGGITYMDFSRVISLSDWQWKLQLEPSDSWPIFPTLNHACTPLTWQATKTSDRARGNTGSWIIHSSEYISVSETKEKRKKESQTFCLQSKGLNTTWANISFYDKYNIIFLLKWNLPT